MNNTIELPPFDPDPIDWSTFEAVTPECVRKRMYADDLAAGLVFEWDYDNANDWDLYECLEAMGYEWDGRSWTPTEPV